MFHIIWDEKAVTAKKESHWLSSNDSIFDEFSIIISETAEIHFTTAQGIENVLIHSLRLHVIRQSEFCRSCGGFGNEGSFFGSQSGSAILGFLRDCSQISLH